jgi:putative ABC transport system permease protein
MRWRERFYRGLLRCYPAEFRDEYAREMLQAFHDGWRAEAASRLWIDLLADVFRTAPKEHLNVLLQDLRYTARMMWKAPAFTAAVVLTVALGIGANTAIFSFVYAVMLRPLPFAEPQRLMQVNEKNDKLNLPNFSASVLNYLSWSEQTQSFERLGAVSFSSFNLSGQAEPEQFTGNRISPSLIPLLGIQPVAGRAFLDGEDKPGSGPVAMVSEGLWRRRFGADPSFVGRNVTLNGVDCTVVGIAPAPLGLLTGGDIWMPLTIDPGRETRLNHVISVFGRLKPGITPRQAQAEMDTIAARVGQQYPEVKDWGIRLLTMTDAFVSPQLRTGLLVLLGAVGCVLLIACANIANLLLARASARQREIAIRTAMGASQPRLLRQLLVESLALSLVGGVVGMVGAVWAVRGINAVLPPNLLPIPDVSVDAVVLLFAFGITVLTGALFGIAPAWHAAKADLNTMLKQAARSTGGSRPRLRNGLAAAELALATVLLIAAGLLVQTLFELQRVKLGFRPDDLLTFQLSLPSGKYAGAKGPAFYRDLLESLRTVPGVRAAGVSSGIPFGAGNYTTTPVTTVGTSVVPPETAIPTDWRIVSPGFFGAMEVPLLRGRDFTDGDTRTAPPVMIVSQATAQKFWGTDDPIGRVIKQLGPDGLSWTVVGVVGDVRSTALVRESPAMYLPLASRVWPMMDVVVRVEGGPESVLPSIRQRVRQLDPELPLATVRTMDQWVSNTAAQPRLNAILLAVFASVALLIAAVGTYGVLAYTVSQRTREIGLRLALGAPRRRVLRLVIREGMTMSVAGIGAGLVTAVAVSQVLGTLVFGVPVRDPATFAAVAMVLTVVALAACAVPALRASRVDPMVSLREE